MPLTRDQIKRLLQVVSSATPDDVDCDGCFGQIAEFAESELWGKSRSGAMQRVEMHLQNCACCQMEFQALLDALRADAQGDDGRPS